MSSKERTQLVISIKKRVETACEKRYADRIIELQTRIDVLIAENNTLKRMLGVL